MGSKAQILAGFQVQSRSSSFQTPTCALQGQLEPQRMQSTSAGHLPSPASQPGNPGILTFSFLGRPKDKASSWAGRRSWHPPVPTVTAWGQKTRPLHLWQGCESQGQISALPLSAASPLALPAGQNEEPGETEAALQTSLESAGMLSHRPPTLLPWEPRLAGRAPVPCAAWAPWVFPWGAHGSALAPAKATTQQPQGDGAKAAAQAGSTHSSITSPWLQIKTISRPQFPLDTVLRGSMLPGKAFQPQRFGREAWRRHNNKPCVTPSFLRKRCSCRHAASHLALSNPPPPPPPPNNCKQGQKPPWILSSCRFDENKQLSAHKGQCQ